jgi:hypothetical protein
VCAWHKSNKVANPKQFSTESWLKWNQGNFKRIFSSLFLREPARKTAPV